MTVSHEVVFFVSDVRLETTSKQRKEHGTGSSKMAAVASKF